MINNVTTDGTYNIVDKKDIPFPVYCDFGPEPGFVWTLIQSHSLNNNRAFRNRSFYSYNMYVNQNNPESWNFYRLSMPRMKSIRDASTHWRATCNFPTDGVDYRDYVRSSHVRDLFAAPDMVSKCRFFEYVNIRGFSCINCTAFTAYGKWLHFHIDSSDDVSKFNCDFNGTQGAVHSEDNFGYYAVTNPAFRCSSSRKSTTQYWLGSYFK